jgi:hypothetical protein
MCYHGFVILVFAYAPEIKDQENQDNVWLQKDHTIMYGRRLLNYS